MSRSDSVPPRPLAASAPSRPLTGVIRAPGDKSISHRALMLGGLAVFGGIGLIVGPLVLTFLVAVLNLYRREFTGPGGPADPSP